MAEPPTFNADLEQALYRTAMRERRFSAPAAISVVVPALVGGLWLFYSTGEVNKWRERSRAVEQREGELEGRERDAADRVQRAEAGRKEADAQLRAVQEEAKAAKARAQDMERRLAKVREGIGSLWILLTDLSSARSSASRLASSEVVENQITGIPQHAGAKPLARPNSRSTVSSRPTSKSHAFYFYLIDEAQRDSATALTARLESQGFDVAGTGTYPARRLTITEVRYFREQDQVEAARLLALIEEQLGPDSCKLSHVADRDQSLGSPKLQVWLGKPPVTPAAPVR